MPSLRLPLNRLRKGMIIENDVYTRGGVVIVPAGTEVTKDVMELLTRHFVDYVIANIDPGSTKKSTAIAEEPAKRITPEQLKQFEDNFDVAEQELAKSLKALVDIDEELDITSLLDSFNQIIDKANDSASLCQMISMLKDKKEGLYTHCVNVGLYSQILAQWADFTDEETELVTVAGMLHDIGLLKVSEERMSNFSFHDELSGKNFEKHAVDGYDILRNKNLDDRIKKAVLTHHERLDGSGFPLHVPGRNIPRTSRVVAIADTYDTLTLKEAHQNTASAFDVLQHLEDLGYGKLDPELLMTFINRISNNLIQHEVVLNNGKVGRVVMNNKYNISRPLIQLENGEFFDLAKHNELHIQDVLL